MNKLVRLMPCFSVMIQEKVSFTTTAIVVSIIPDILAAIVVVVAGVEHLMSTNGLRKQLNGYLKSDTAI